MLLFKGAGRTWKQEEHPAPRPAHLQLLPCAAPRAPAAATLASVVRVHRRPLTSPACRQHASSCLGSVETHAELFAASSCYCSANFIHIPAVSVSGCHLAQHQAITPAYSLPQLTTFLSKCVGDSQSQGAIGTMPWNNGRYPRCAVSRDVTSRSL